MFVTIQHQHSDRPSDSMNIWLEDIKIDGFVVCLREFMTFDGIHSGLKVVSNVMKMDEPLQKRFHRLSSGMARNNIGIGKR